MLQRQSEHILPYGNLYFSVKEASHKYRRMEEEKSRNSHNENYLKSLKLTF